MGRRAETEHVALIYDQLLYIYYAALDGYACLGQPQDPISDNAPYLFNFWTFAYFRTIQH